MSDGETKNKMAGQMEEANGTLDDNEEPTEGMEIHVSRIEVFQIHGESLVYELASYMLLQGGMSALVYYYEYNPDGELVIKGSSLFPMMSIDRIDRRKSKIVPPTVKSGGLSVVPLNADKDGLH